MTHSNTRFPSAVFNIDKVSINPVYFRILSFNKYCFLLHSFTYPSVNRNINSLVPVFIYCVLYKLFYFVLYCTESLILYEVIDESCIV